MKFTLHHGRGELGRRVDDGYTKKIESGMDRSLTEEQCSVKLDFLWKWR